MSQEEPQPGIPAVLMNDYGFSLPPDISLDDWLSMGSQTIQGTIRLYNSTPYIIGDWINYGMDHWPEQYAQGVDMERFTESQLNRWAYVCRHVPVENRRISPSHTHSFHVARLTPSQQKKLLDKSTACGWSARELLKAVEETYPNEQERRGRKPKVKLTFEQWSEAYFSEHDMTTEPGKEGMTYVSPAIIEILQVAWEAGRANK